MRVRATFLVRFTLVTFASAGIAAIALAFALDGLHRRSLENDATIAALGRIDARLLAPLAAYGRPGSGASVELAQVAREAMLDPFVAGLRIYDDTGRSRSLTAGAVALIFVSLVTLAAGASRELERRRRAAQSTFVETLVTLAETVDLRDPYTAGHSQRVAAYSKRLALALQLQAADVESIEHGALLHDLGKIGVPDAVLFKNGALDQRERHLIQHHPVLGARLMARVPGAECVTPCVLHHHERVDGTGYPDGLAGDAIPMGARIIAVADAFDAMTTDRPYRRALGADEAVARLMQGMGTQFDSRCVAAFRVLVRSGAIVPPPSTGTVVFAQRAVIELAEAI